MTAAVGSLRAARLLTGLRLRQQLNQFVSVYRHRTGAAKRGGTARKSRTGGVFGALVVVAMVFGIGNVAYQSAANVGYAARTAELRVQLQEAQARLVELRAAQARTAQARDPAARTTPDGGGSRTGTQAPRPTGAQQTAPQAAATRHALAAPWTPGVVRGETFVASLALIAALFLALAGREIVRADWDLEWLATLPLPTATLVGGRLAERAVTNLGGIIVLIPVLSVMAWYCGHVWTAPLAGIALALPLLLLVATFQTLVDTGLRLTLAPSKLRNLHAAISLVSTLPLLLLISLTIRDNTLVFGWAVATPEWVGWLPGGLAVRALAAPDGAAAAQWAALLVAEVALATALGFAVLMRLMRHGVIAAGVREAARRPMSTPRPVAARVGADTPSLLSALQRRELRLLGRDRTFMAQTLLLPVFTVAVQLVLNVHSNIFAGAVDAPANLSAIAFGVAAYTLMFSAFQTLNAEGQSLWVLFCVPHPLESILREKARLWATVAIIYPVVIFAIAIGVAGHVSPQLLGCLVMVAVGVPIFAVIATALGVFGCNPLEQDVQKRVRPTYLYLYMLLVSFYVYAFYANTLAQRGTTIVLTGLVALALWQKARDRFNYLLDPSASPPAQVSVADGLIAALMFFVLQEVISLIEIASGQHTLTAKLVWIAFSIAGAATYGTMRLVYWRAGTAGVPRVLGPGVPAALTWGLGGGVTAALSGLAYISAARAFDWFPALKQGNPFDSPSTVAWLAALAVVAAPIFEEFIFRGLIFGGLRRSLGFGAAAVASAAIFAIVHPPASVAPVFVLGLCAAFAYERTRMLAAPMIVHAVYNAAVLAFQWNLMQQSV
jgi:membrane protease YdiL (CAAX protease family)